MGWKEVLQIVLFVFAWVPVGFLVGNTVFGVSGTYTDDFMIYNEDWNGLSDFRLAIEDNGYETKTIETSMSVISRYNGSAILVIMGPVKDFTIDATLTIFEHLQKGGGVFIADDFGTANSSFYWLNNWLAPMFTGGLPIDVDGVVSFADGVLLDLDSYDSSPKLPVISRAEGGFQVGLDGGALTQGVNELHLNWASALHPRSLLGAAGVAFTTPRAWCETDIQDQNPAPNETELSGRLPVCGALSLGSDMGRLVVMSDPSAFANDMWQRFEGNRRFGMNIVNWAAQNNVSWPVLFCENLLHQPLTSAEFYYSAYLGRVLWMTTNFLLAPLYPIMTAIGIKKYLPDPKKPEAKSVSEVFLRRGQTYFSERMSYYRSAGNYSRVVKMLYRKMRRDLRKKHQWREFDVKKLWDLYKYKDPKVSADKFFKTIEKIEQVSSNPNKRIRESEMMEFFFFMRNITSLLIETRT